MRVERIAHRVGAPRLVEIDMRDLARRVNTSISAAGALDAAGFTREAVDRRFDRILDATPIRL
jgi:hypothetical protein